MSLYRFASPATFYPLAGTLIALHGPGRNPMVSRM